MMENQGEKSSLYGTITKEREFFSSIVSRLVSLTFLRVPQSSHLRSDDPHPVLMDEPDGILSGLAVLPECHQ